MAPRVDRGFTRQVERETLVRGSGEVVENLHVVIIIELIDQHGIFQGDDDVVYVAELSILETLGILRCLLGLLQDFDELVTAEERSRNRSAVPCCQNCGLQLAQA